MPKGTFRAEATSNSKRNQARSIELCLAEGISQSVSQKKIPLIFFKIPWQLLQELRVDLKTFLGLVLPNQYCPSSSGKFKAGFWVV